MLFVIAWSEAATFVACLLTRWETVAAQHQSLHQLHLNPSPNFRNDSSSKCHDSNSVTKNQIPKITPLACLFSSSNHFQKCCPWLDLSQVGQVNYTSLHDHWFQLVSLQTSNSSSSCSLSQVCAVICAVCPTLTSRCIPEQSRNPRNSHISVCFQKLDYFCGIREEKDDLSERRLGDEDRLFRVKDPSWLSYCVSRGTDTAQRD